MRIAPLAVAGVLAFSLPAFAEHDDHSDPVWRPSREIAERCNLSLQSRAAQGRDNKQTTLSSSERYAMYFPSGDQSDCQFCPAPFVI